jgi:hypothetical protein
MVRAGRAFVIATLAALFLAGCMKLNDAGADGGIVSFPTNVIDGLKLASAHCAKYDRNAHLVDQDMFETITFECIGP